MHSMGAEAWHTALFDAHVTRRRRLDALFRSACTVERVCTPCRRQVPTWLPRGRTLVRTPRSYDRTAKAAPPRRPPCTVTGRRPLPARWHPSSRGAVVGPWRTAYRVTRGLARSRDALRRRLVRVGAVPVRCWGCGAGVQHATAFVPLCAPGRVVRLTWGFLCRYARRAVAQRHRLERCGRGHADGVLHICVHHVQRLHGGPIVRQP